MKSYEDGIHDGITIAENTNAKLTPFRVMKAVNSVPFGMQPMYKPCAYFADEDDAEAFMQMMENREKKGGKRYLYRIDVMKPQPVPGDEVSADGE